MIIMLIVIMIYKDILLSLESNTSVLLYALLSTFWTKAFNLGEINKTILLLIHLN